MKFQRFQKTRLGHAGSPAHKTLNARVALFKMRNTA